MKIRVLSDLHLEFAGWRPPQTDEGIVVLAGDIHEGRSGIAWARKYFRDRPIVYVPGNHEYYGRDLDELRDGLRESALTHGVHLLDGDEVILNGVRFLGATLWTDFELYGSDPRTVERAMRQCQEGMTDFQVIRRWGGNLRAEDSREFHLARVAWLERRLEAEFRGPTVVVTHHAPSPRSVARQFAGSLLTPSFASDLTRLMGLPRVPPVVADAIPAPVTPALWIHGHMHQSYDYVECDTRVVCNPRGYFPYEPNPDFDPTMVVEVRA